MKKIEKPTFGIDLANKDEAPYLSWWKFEEWFDKVIGPINNQEVQTDIKYDAGVVVKQAQGFLDSFKKRMSELADEILGEVYVNCMPHIETDTWTNYREFLRIELEHEYKYSKFKDDWAVRFRRAVFVENREEFAELVSNDILKRIKDLEDRHQEYEMFRYSPGGDNYQDIKKQLDSYKEKFGKL